MCINTFWFIMLREVKGAKLSLIEEHIEVVIFCIVMDKSSQNLLLVMGIWAKISIGAFLHTMREVWTKLFFVFLKAIMLFHEWMCIEAIITFWTFLIYLDIAAHISMVEVAIAFPVLSVVVVDAMFVVVAFCNIAGSYLENI